MTSSFTNTNYKLTHAIRQVGYELYIVLITFTPRPSLASLPVAAGSGKGSQSWHGISMHLWR